MIIISIKAYIDQHAATQSTTINKLNTRIDQCFEQLQAQKSQHQPLKPQKNLQHNTTWTLQHHSKSSFTSNRMQVTTITFTRLQLNPKENKSSKEVYLNKHQVMWILNWSKGQKALEMLPNKPNLPSRLWKAIATGNYMDLAEFGYKNLKANMKYNDDEHSLQTSEGEIIAVRKRSCPQKFTDIAEWLLAF
ncbi:hypothetical protein C2G38_2043182 [Gigaspora rosea]|uniref:Uncharacterized protein n=1 Tax=Gigaspora rosea TaxID=44941 RepID=A0A397UL11_9GLOM|nr:hypothetical protein C2G38_2043182 [Gigaspora rosea]